jgi:hypothetical protein
MEAFTSLARAILKAVLSPCFQGVSDGVRQGLGARGSDHGLPE